MAGGCCPVGGFGLGGSTGAILVLFILLVIITKALWV
nr:sporulation protein YjcZ [Paenibacillus glacialis]